MYNDVELILDGTFAANWLWIGIWEQRAWERLLGFDCAGYYQFLLDDDGA